MPRTNYLSYRSIATASGGGFPINENENSGEPRGEVEGAGDESFRHVIECSRAAPQPKTCNFNGQLAGPRMENREPEGE